MADIRDHVTIHEGDLVDLDFVSSTIARVRPDWVFSSAAYGAYSSETDAAQMMRTNVTGFQNLLEAAAIATVEVFVNVASCFEYGETDETPDESSRCSPSTDYGVSRLAGTVLCNDWAQKTGVRATTLRLYSTHGPFEDPRRLITRLCRSALRREQPAMKTASSAHDYTYVDDVVDALVLVAQSPTSGPLYNVGTGVGADSNQLASIVGDLTGFEITEAERSPGMTTWVANADRLRTELEWRPRYSLRDGIEQTLRWIKANEHLYPATP